MLRNFLLNTLPEGNKNLYFQPSDSLTLIYPCIIYSLDDVDIKHASNKPYNVTKRYKITVIDRDPLSVIADKVLLLQSIAFDRFYTSDNLNHYVYNLYY